MIQQLSLCCAQLEVAGQTGVPDSVVHLLKEVQVCTWLGDVEGLRGEGGGGSETQSCSRLGMFFRQNSHIEAIRVFDFSFPGHYLFY